MSHLHTLSKLHSADNTEKMVNFAEETRRLREENERRRREIERKEQEKRRLEEQGLKRKNGWIGAIPIRAQGRYLPKAELKD